MLKEFLKKRANKDVFDLPDWVTYTYLLSCCAVSILVVYFVADHLPAKIGVMSLLSALVCSFMGLGLFLHEWATNSPLKRIIPILTLILFISLGLLFTQVLWLGPIGLLALAYQRFRIWRSSKKTCTPNAP